MTKYLQMTYTPYFIGYPPNSGNFVEAIFEIKFNGETIEFKTTFENVYVIDYLALLGFQLITHSANTYTFQFIADDFDDVMRVAEDLKDLANDPSVLED